MSWEYISTVMSFFEKSLFSIVALLGLLYILHQLNRVAGCIMPRGKARKWLAQCFWSIIWVFGLYWTFSTIFRSFQRYKAWTDKLNRLWYDTSGTSLYQIYRLTLVGRLIDDLLRDFSKYLDKIAKTFFYEIRLFFNFRYFEQSTKSTSKEPTSVKRNIFLKIQLSVQWWKRYPSVIMMKKSTIEGKNQRISNLRISN